MILLVIGLPDKGSFPRVSHIQSMDSAGREQVIVVSDLHLGAEGADSGEFSRFIRWLRYHPGNDAPLAFSTGDGPDGRGGGEARIYRPTTLVLLGDILELWDPRDQNPHNVVRDAIGPLSCLHDLPCRIVYVTGNHDEDIGSLATSLGKGFSWGEGGGNDREAGPDSGQAPGDPDVSSFVFGIDSYPEPELRSFTTKKGKVITYYVLTGMPVGTARYGFVHGQQFDREQIQYLISKVFNKRFDPVDTLNDLAHVTMTSEMQAQGRLITAAWVCSILLVSGFLGPVVTSALSVLLLLVPFIILVSKHRDAHHVINEYRVTGWRKTVIGWFFLWSLPTVMALFVLAGLAGIFPAVTTRFLPVLELIVLTVLFIMIPFVQFLARAKRGAYDYLVKNPDKSAEKVLESGFSPMNDSFDCDVVVFGHTHQAGWSVVPAERRNPDIRDKQPLLFINAGTWKKGYDTTYLNSFVSINDEGVSLLKWDGGGAVTCLRHFSMEELRRDGIAPA